MYSDKNFGENEMNDMLKKFNQKNQKEDDEDKNFIILKTDKDNYIDYIISSFNQQINYIINRIKLLNITKEEKDDIIKNFKNLKKLQNEIIKLKDNSYKYGGNKYNSGNLKPKNKNKTEIYNYFKTINIEQNINNNFFLNNDQQNYKYNEYNNMISNFNKNNNNFNNVNHNMRSDYSFKCLSENDELTKTIYENDIDFVAFNLVLQNNGSLPWPKAETKLVFEDAIFDEENSKEVILEEQEKDEEKGYIVIFQKLNEYQTGEYTSKLRFNVNGKNIGEEIVLKIIIDEYYDISNLKKEVGDNENELSKLEEVYYRYSN